MVTAVGTAMLLSISKIWGNHRGNIWLNDNGNNQLTLSDQDFIERISPSRGLNHDRFLHPKDLSTFLFQYEISRRHGGHHQKKNMKNGDEEITSDAINRPIKFKKNKKVDNAEKKTGSKNENDAKIVQPHEIVL